MDHGWDCSVGKICFFFKAKSMQGPWFQLLGIGSFAVALPQPPIFRVMLL